LDEVNARKNFKIKKISVVIYAGNTENPDLTFLDDSALHEESIQKINSGRNRFHVGRVSRRSSKGAYPSRIFGEVLKLIVSQKTIRKAEMEIVTPMEKRPRFAIPGMIISYETSYLKGKKICKT